MGASEDNILSSIREIYKYRSLVWAMTTRELKIRYSQTALGFFWAVLKPLVYLGIYTFFFTIMMPIEMEEAPYTLVALCGLMGWAYFLDIVNSAGESIINDAQIIKKNYFPIIVLPVYKSLLGLVELGISFIVFFIIQLILGHPFQWTVIFIPIVIILNFIMGFGIRHENGH